MSLSKIFHPLLVLVQPWNRPDMTEQLMTGMKSIETNKTNVLSFLLQEHCWC